MAQLELVLKDDLEKLIPAMIEWNNSELLAQVEALLPKYQNAIYNENNISQAKEDRARLNAFTKALNSERLQIKNRYTVPLDKFTAEVNEVIEKVQGVADKIGATIAEYDNKRKDEKRVQIFEYFSSKVGDLSSLVTLEMLEDSKWYNATSKLKSIYSEIDEKLAKIHDDLRVIESLGGDDVDALKLFYFRTRNLSAALQENTRLKEEKVKIAELNAKVKESVIKAVELTEEEEFTIRFEVKGTSTEFANLKKFLKDNNIKYKAIKED